MSGGTVLDQIEIKLRNRNDNSLFSIYIDVHDSSLSRKWLTSLNLLLQNNYHLEKNYCFFGFVEHQRNGVYILDQVNKSIAAINLANLGYTINDHFSMDNTISDDLEADPDHPMGRNIIHSRLNWLHRYFEDLQGVSGRMSTYFNQATPAVRWHIRQLNLLCHEFESWALSYRKQLEAPEWSRRSQLMCWLHAPRFQLEVDDYSLFGIEQLNRPLGSVTVGINKAIGKSHWEVFNDEGVGIEHLVTTAMRPQSEAAGDFDIEWARDPSEFIWQKQRLDSFRQWLRDNQFDPEDPGLTIGHPRVAQVDLARTFGSVDYQLVWDKLIKYLDVWSIKTSDQHAVYDYCWSDSNYSQRQIQIIQQGYRT